MALLISDRSGNSKMSRTFLNLAFGSASGIGGSERRMLELVHELKSRDINIRAMVPGPAESPLNLELRKAGASTAIYRSPASLAIQSARSRARATWAFGARAAIPLLIARKTPSWRGGRLLVAKNGLDAYRSRWTIALESRFMRSADLVIANSSAAATQATTRTRIPRYKVLVLPSALPSEWHVPSARSQHDRVRIGMIGNDRPEKQHALGVRVFCELQDEGTTLTIFTNRGGNVRTILESAEARVARRVSIHEAVPVTPSIMSDLDVLLHPSSSESLPRVALEARSQGVWVVGFDVGDLAQYCEAVVPWGDESGLRNSLSRACEQVRQGKRPSHTNVLGVPEYADALLATLDIKSSLSADSEGEVPG